MLVGDDAVQRVLEYCQVVKAPFIFASKPFPDLQKALKVFPLFVSVVGPSDWVEQSKGVDPALMQLTLPVNV